MRSLRLTLALALLAATGLSACVSVPAYQRGILARPAMSTEFESGEAAFATHVFNSREGATGGNGSTGGGCGCN